MTPSGVADEILDLATVLVSIPSVSHEETAIADAMEVPRSTVARALAHHASR